MVRESRRPLVSVVSTGGVSVSTDGADARWQGRDLTRVHSYEFKRKCSAMHNFGVGSVQCSGCRFFFFPEHRTLNIRSCDSKWRSKDVTTKLQQMNPGSSKRVEPKWK